MPVPYSNDLRWRAVWLYLAGQYSFQEISQVLQLSDRSVRRYIDAFLQTGEVKPKSYRHGPTMLLGEFEQILLLRLVLNNPGIYLDEIQIKLYQFFGVVVSLSTICRTLRYMGCTRQVMKQVPLQRSDNLRGKFMADISVYDPSMLVWVDESGFDKRNAVRKYGYSIKGAPLCNHHLFIRGIRYTAIPIVSMEGVHDVYIAEGNIDGTRFHKFVQHYLLPVLMPFNSINTRSVVCMDNASIHHVQEVKDELDQFGYFYNPIHLI